MKKLSFISIITMFIVFLFTSCKKDIQNQIDSENALVKEAKQKIVEIDSKNANERCNIPTAEVVGGGWQVQSVSGNMALIRVEVTYRYYDPRSFFGNILLVSMQWQEGTRTQSVSYAKRITSLGSLGELNTWDLNGALIPVPVDKPFTINGYGISLCRYTHLTSPIIIIPSNYFNKGEINKFFIEKTHASALMGY